ncbi:oligosaccharide flippase family protein [bacterium]|nr:oligosaccharide flippase family protein [candidate division CSSED10-310 bacterium]
MDKSDHQFRKIFHGFLSLSVAKIVFMIAGYAVYFSLPRLFGSAGEFGNYGVVIGLLNVFNMVLITGTIQAVSKFTSEKNEIARSIRRAALRIQSVIGGMIFLFLLLGAPRIALLFGDPDLTAPIRAGSFIPLFYSFYAVFVGSLNGRRMFTQQAALDISFAFLKTAGILTMAALGFGVTGALSGFSSAALIILIVAGLVVSGESPRSDRVRFPADRIFAFEIWVIFITLTTNLLINADLFFVKSLLDPSVASTYTGYYTAVQTFARIPYTLVIAISLIVYPLISRSTFQNDLKQSQSYVRNSIRLALLIVVPIAAVFFCFPSEFLGSVYPDEYIAGSSVLRMLPIGSILLSIMYVMITMITGSGFPRISLAITCVALAADAAACWFLVPVYSIRGAAAGSITGWGTGTLLAGIWICRHFRMVTLSKTPVRIISAGILGSVAGWFVPGGGWIRLLTGSSTVLAVYGIVLWGLGEINRVELIGMYRKFRTS